MRQPQDPTSAIRWLPFLHTEDSVIPPFAVMRVTGYDSDTGYYSVARPNAASMTEILINGPSAIAPYGEGQGHCSDPCTALYEPNDGTPANGEDWGTASGSWKLAKDNTGFRVLGNAANGTAEFRFLGVAYGELSAARPRYVVALTCTTADVDLTTGAIAAGSTVNGEILQEGDLVLVPFQTDPAENGLYEAGAALTTPLRSGAFDAGGSPTWDGMAGGLVGVTSGVLYGDSLWLNNNERGEGTLTTAPTATADVYFSRIDFPGLAVRKNTGADVGIRRRLNLIEGSNVTLTVADDSGNDEIDVTIAASGGSGLPADPNDTRLLGWDDTDNDAAWFDLSAAFVYDHATHALSLDADLEAIAAFTSSGTVTGVACRTGDGTWSLRSLTAGDGITISDGVGVSGNPTISADPVSAVGGWKKVTIGYASMSAAATSKTVLLHTLAAAGDISDVVIKASTVFAGTTTLTCDVTVSGNNVITSHDLKAAVSGTNFTATYRDDSPYLKVWDFGSTTAINLVVTSTGANLDQLTQGSVDVWLKIASLP